MQDRPITTLYMLMSVDGKISTGDTNEMDVDKDFPNIPGVSEGLHQYYDIEKTTDYFSLNSGKVFAKIGFNNRDIPQVKIPVVFVVIDNKPHLTEKGINYLSKLSEKVVVVTTNNSHPAKSASGILENIEILQYEQKIDFVDMFKKLKTQFGAERVTIQSGGALNSEFLKLGLIDNLSIVVAPILIGGKNTPSLIDGESLHVVEDLQNIRALKLENVDVLENSYLHLKYKVIN